MKNKTIGLLLIITLASLSRFLPHPPNMTPIIGISILSVASFNHRLLQFGVPLCIMLLTDMVIGFHSLMPIVYIAMMVAGVGGVLLKKEQSFPNMIGASILGAIIFFIITNLGVWMISDLYPKTLTGLSTCFAMAIPFFHNTLIGTVGVMMGLYGLEKFNDLWIKKLTTSTSLNKMS